MPYCFLFFLLLYDMQSDKVFIGKKQICTSANVIDKEWNLKLKRDKTFEYVISEFSTINYKQGIKNDTLRFTGFWQFYDDTLFLHSPDLTRQCNKEVRYKKKGESFYSIGACIDSLAGYQVKSLNPVSGKGKMTK